MKEKFVKFYQQVTTSTASLSHCNRKKVGAIIIDSTGNNIISFGYNGMPSGLPNCCEDEHNNTLQETIHAEANAITKLAKGNGNANNGTMFVTLSPCKTCAGLIIQSGIKTVYYQEQYRCDGGLKLLEQAGVQVIQLPVHDS